MERAHALVNRRRVVVAAAALAPLLAPVPAGGVAARARAPVTRGRPLNCPDPVRPVSTTAEHWDEVTDTLARDGQMLRGLYFHVPFPRDDLRVCCRGVRVSPALALGSHVSFVHYEDGSTLVMGDLVATEGELPKLTDALRAEGFTQTAIHKHLPAHSPEVWWTHAHAHGDDPAALARGLRTALRHTATPPPGAAHAAESVDLDTDGIAEALGTKGVSSGGVHSCTFNRRETITDMGRELPPGLGATTALNFQPLGGGRAALSGDFAMTAEEVPDALAALRRGGIELVELHNHGLTDQPRLFFTHFWAVDDAVKLARALRPALDTTNVEPSVP
ncbi:DUF1259 domain-containing protein [Streptomyces orinoci]|uniref:DUF1259 domain-containing protein n=1 Tax=Streptomyces orinoci TaxID=67339 RepID=A0ABV3K3G7_STRON|nr:DUF1259 domain-containing protein [Streptomyces orinoci]